MDLELDPATHDLVISDVTHDLAILDAPDSIAQKLAIRLQFFLGDFFLDERIGIPYFSKVFVKAPSLVLIRALFRDAILTTPGVISIERFDMDFDIAQRTLTPSFSVKVEDQDAILDFSREFVLL